jgi:transposase
MTAPGVGVVVAASFKAGVDAPERFSGSRNVGAHFGLTSRRYASGEMDRRGRISKCRDELVRTSLYEAANVLLTRVKRWSTLKAWGIKIAKKAGRQKATVAVARNWR